MNYSSPMPPTPIHVTKNEAASRFEAEVDGHVAFVDYRVGRDGRMIFTHTEVPPALEGRGIASQLVKTALDTVRAEHQKAVSLCPYVDTYLERHPEYKDLFAS